MEDLRLAVAAVLEPDAGVAVHCRRAEVGAVAGPLSCGVLGAMMGAGPTARSAVCGQAVEPFAEEMSFAAGECRLLGQ